MRLLSKPIYVFDENISKISELLTMTRKLNKKVIVFENDSKFYDAYFKEETDIILNPHKKDGYAWDMLDELDRDYIRFVQAITDIAELENDDKKTVERCFFKILSRMDKMLPNQTTMEILDQPLPS